ncbi:hypothetical protein D1007_54028 [Hordeum vulgare]|nr:hypothetical protein D1007_54028 [Hordeum vulgare]
MLHIRDVQGPKKTGSVETRLEAMEQQVFKCQGMVERGLSANHMMITEFTSMHKMDAIDIGKHLSRLYDREAENRGFVQWVGPEWPPAPQNTLLKLCEMYEESGSGRRKDNLESSLTIDHLTEEKNKLEGNYHKLVQDVHEIFNSQEDRMMDFTYLNDRMKVVEEKYKVLMNLSQAQGTVIRNLKLKHFQDKEQVSEASKNKQLQVDELNKSEENLTQENSKLKLHMGDLKKGHEKLTVGKAELKLHIADLLR